MSPTPAPSRAPPSGVAALLGGLAFVVLAGTLAGGPLASLARPPSPPVLMLLLGLAAALAQARRRLAGYHRLLEEGARATPDLRRRLIETENQRDRLTEENLRKRDFETGFARLVEEMESAARHREQSRKRRARMRLEVIRLKSENRGLRRSIRQARLDLTVIRERIDRLGGGRMPTRLARVRSAFRAFAASPEILDSIRRLEALSSWKPVLEPEGPPGRGGRRRDLKQVSGQPSPWDHPRTPWRSPDSREPATRCP